MPHNHVLIIRDISCGNLALFAQSWYFKCCPELFYKILLMHSEYLASYFVQFLFSCKSLDINSFEQTECKSISFDDPQNFS